MAVEYAKLEGKNLKGKDLIDYKKNLPQLTQVQKDILLGSLIGTASINFKSTSVRFEKEFKRKDYVYKAYQVLCDRTGTVPKKRRIVSKGKTQESIWFRTYQHTSFEFYRNIFYHNCETSLKYQKIVPKLIHKYLTPRALAYWFMDTGSFKGISKKAYPIYGTYILNTRKYTLKENRCISRAIGRCFHIQVTIVSEKQNQYFLRIGQQSREKFVELIKPYILKGFEDKVYQSSKELPKNLSRDGLSF